MLLIQGTGTELNTHELYGDDKLICYGLKCIFYHIVKNLSGKMIKTATSVIQRRIETNARSFTGYILQYNSEGH